MRVWAAIGARPHAIARAIATARVVHFLESSAIRAPTSVSFIANTGPNWLTAVRLDNLQLLPRRQRRKRPVRLGLIPVRDRRDVILQRQVRAIPAPSQRLN